MATIMGRLTNQNRQGTSQLSVFRSGFLGVSAFAAPFACAGFSLRMRFMNSSTPPYLFSICVLMFGVSLIALHIICTTSHLLYPSRSASLQPSKLPPLACASITPSRILWRFRPIAFSLLLLYLLLPSLVLNRFHEVPFPNQTTNKISPPRYLMFWFAGFRNPACKTLQISPGLSLSFPGQNGQFFRAPFFFAFAKSAGLFPLPFRALQRNALLPRCQTIFRVF